ncbi:hypothetical protein HK405_011507 [Cladochytrium tenue]|nr:hypothetical protein HK405_011507 [Cladochytrium tenue]
MGSWWGAPRPYSSATSLLRTVVLAAATAFVVFPAPALMVKHHDFKRCDQSGFCVRQRAHARLADLFTNPAPGEPVNFTERYTLDLTSLAVDEAAGTVRASLVDADAPSTAGSPRLRFELDLLAAGAVRVRLVEDAVPAAAPDATAGDAGEVATPPSAPAGPRFELLPRGGSQALDLPPTEAAAQPATAARVLADDGGSAELRVAAPDGRQLVVRVAAQPFSVSVSDAQDGGGLPLVVINGRGYLNYELRRRKDDPSDEVPAAADEASLDDRQKEVARLMREVKKDLWEESFGGKKDSKPYGPTSIGVDVSFPGSAHAYGLPEHASSFALKPTRGAGAAYTDPYRLYNFDVFEYELDSPMALYGSVPFVMAHSARASIGALWLSAAEMWVDVEKTVGADGVPTTHTHWMAESGILDFLLFLGPRPHDVANQLTLYTGRPGLPQYFAIGYHQCRWNYLDQDDVTDVDASFDAHDIPYDVIWLDIEHTDGKRYLTWDKAKFPDPKAMLANLAKSSRKMVTIVDPHIKADGSYFVSKEAKELNLFVKNSGGTDTYEGWCWPGSSNWIDYLNPDAREFWARKFALDQYEHRATFEGLLQRGANADRPFVLSRAYFIGTQRYGAIWTGDNFARWDHLEATVPMLLSNSIAGIVFSGADVGGFFGNTEPELLVRWYQTGVFQPFFRAHAHIDTKRREPWLFGEPYTTLLREAVRTRYRLMPYLYTAFWEASVSGKPIMRPLLSEFPQDEATFAIDDSFMVGDALLIRPVVNVGSTSVNVYLPPSSVWYDYFTLGRVTSGNVTADAPLEKTPVFMRGGTIIPRRDRMRRSSTLTLRDPFTLVVALSAEKTAHGKLYLDDGHSYEHERGMYLLSKLAYTDGVLTCTSERQEGGGVGTPAEAAARLGARVERLIITGLRAEPRSVVVRGGRKLEFRSAQASSGTGVVVTVKDPGVRVGEDWQISVQI